MINDQYPASLSNYDASAFAVKTRCLKLNLFEIGLSNRAHYASTVGRAFLGTASLRLCHFYNISRGHVGHVPARAVRLHTANSTLYYTTLSTSDEP